MSRGIQIIYNCIKIIKLRIDALYVKRNNREITLSILKKMTEYL